MTSAKRGGATRKQRNDERREKEIMPRLGTTEEGNSDSLYPVRTLNSLADALRISDKIRNKAAEISEMAHAKGLDRGSSASSMVAASVYAACRIVGSTNTLREVSRASGMNVRKVAGTYRLLFNELELRVAVTDPAEYVSLVARRADLKDDATISLALRILKDRHVAPLLAGKDPMGLAAAALYMASVLTKAGSAEASQKEMARAAGVSEVTIRNRYKEIESVGEGGKMFRSGG